MVRRLVVRFLDYLIHLLIKEEKRKMEKWHRPPVVELAIKALEQKKGVQRIQDYDKELIGEELVE